MRAVVDEIKENKVKTAVCTPLPEYHIRVIVHQEPLLSLIYPNSFHLAPNNARAEEQMTHPSP